jgi:16S rRNA (cytidine1402-2'-O)-methyltransferase
VFIARELTKMFEEFISGTPAECKATLGDRVVKGEVTLVINPK